MVFGGSGLIGIILTIALHSVGLDLGLNLTIVGLILAIVLPLGIEVRNRTSRPRRIIVLDYRSHQYGHAVARGVIRLLNTDKRQWQTDVRSTGTSSTVGALQWQIRELQAATIDEIDGIVLIPAADSDDLWYAVAAAIKSGTFVVVVDTKPPNAVFRDVGIDPPRFVSTRYSRTGILIGRAIRDWLLEDPTRTCLLWNGPDGSWPGEERSRNIVYELAAASLLNRCTLYPISSWSPDVTRCRDAMAFASSSQSGVAIYCADDENAMALHLLTLTEAASLRSRMIVIGCNGTPDDWGNVQALDMRAVNFTVDILAEQQGEQVALLFVKERKGKLSAAIRSVYIEPELLSPASGGARWLDSIFGESSPASSTADAADSIADELPATEAIEQHALSVDDSNISVSDRRILEHD